MAKKVQINARTKEESSLVIQALSDSIGSAIQRSGRERDIITLPAIFQNVGELRLRVDALANRLGLDSVVVRRVNN